MKNIELAYLAVAYGMAGIIFYASRHHSYPTVSHIATHRKLTQHVFFWGLLVSGVLFVYLMYGWLIPHLSLGPGVKALVIALVLCQILTGLFPIESKKYRKAHLISGLGLGLCMLSLVTVLALEQSAHHGVRLIDGLLALGMVALLANAWRLSRDSYLLHEKIFFGFWHMAIFITVYFS